MSQTKTAFTVIVLLVVVLRFEMTERTKIPVTPLSAVLRFVWIVLLVGINVIVWGME